VTKSPVRSRVVYPWRCVVVCWVVVLIGGVLWRLVVMVGVVVGCVWVGVVSRWSVWAPHWVVSGGCRVVEGKLEGGSVFMLWVVL